MRHAELLRGIFDIFLRLLDRYAISDGNIVSGEVLLLYDLI